VIKIGMMEEEEGTLGDSQDPAASKGKKREFLAILPGVSGPGTQPREG